MKDKPLTAKRSKKIVEAMIRDVAKNGGEYTFKTVKGKVQDIHYGKA
jgi:hypothetical protein